MTKAIFDLVETTDAAGNVAYEEYVQRPDGTWKCLGFWAAVDDSVYENAGLVFDFDGELGWCWPY